MAQWTKREHSKGEIDRVADRLLPWWTDPDAETTPEIGRCYGVVQNWRTSHGFPLNTFQMGLRRRAARVERGALVAQRLKRFSSIMNKLKREPTMKLSQMQDLGGCRAIVSSVENVDKLYDLYRGDGRLFEEGGLRCDDYIRNPKSDGYRGIHVVGRYRARKPEHQIWNGNRIEVQLRTTLQHAFATAVETVTTFTRNPLKFGGGPDDWRRFFALMGSAIAIREGTPLVEGTPTAEADLIAELKDASRALRVRERLRGWTQTLKQLPNKNIRGAKWLLLALDVRDSTIMVSGFENRQKAAEVVASIEKEGRQIDAVLVWVRSFRDLRKAYPNYYADTTEFIRALTLATRG